MNAQKRKDIEQKISNDRLQKCEGKSKEHLNMVVIGHVDAGKSTLMGHLLSLLGEISEKAMHK